MVPPITFMGREIYAYTLTALVGLLVTIFFSYWLAKRMKTDEYTMLFAILIAAAGAFLGGHILYALTNLDYLVYLFQNLDRIPNFSTFLSYAYPAFSGSVFYGGLLGGLALACVYVKKIGQPMKPCADIGAVAIPTFHAFGRLGCFLSGCCFGIESEIGFVMHHSIVEEGNGVRRFPVQLLEVGFNVVLAVVFYLNLRKCKAKGKLLHLYFYAYPVFRFLNEFLRGDAYRGIYGGLSTSQWISVALVIGNTLILLRNIRKEKSAA